MKYLYIHLTHIAWRVWTGIFLSGFPPTTSAVSDQTSPYLSLNTKTDSFIVSSSGTEYILVSGVSVTQSDAASWCRTHEKAGHLVTLENKSELGGVFSGLLQINKKNLQGDVWIQGTTGSPVIEFSPTEDPTGADKPGGLHFEDIIIDGHKTTRCVVINISGNVGSRRKGVLSFKRRTCHSINDKFLCEVDPLPPFKYLVAQGVGKCPYGSKAAIAGNIYMSASNCTSLGGVHDTRDSGHQISICTLDWCAVQSPTGGWAFALNGLCASKRYFTAGVKSNHGMCYATRGEYDHTGFANSPVCWMQLCFLGETPPTRDSFAVVGSMNCPIDQKYGSVSIYSVTDQCFRAGGEIFGQLSSIYTEREWVKCLFKTCRLGKDCKTTERGKEYRGSLDRTISGKKCQYWSDQEPHRHANTNPDWFPDKNLSDARNYCRNPGDWVEGPYCYTTDPKVTWEICDLPFCQGSGPETTSFDIGESTYIVIPGLHNDPSKYCRNRFGASLAFIQDKYELEKISEHLMNLIEKGDLKPDTAEIWVAGKTRLLPDVLVEDFNSVINEDWPQNCILLSRWNSSALIYNNREFQLYSSKCQIYMRNFLCEVVEVRIPNYELYGGKLQRNITSELDCKVSCVPPCTGIDYNVNCKFEPVWTLSEHTEYEILKKALPMSCYYVGLCLSANLCLKYGGLVFFQIARAMTVVFTVAVSVIVLKRKMSWKVFGCCLIATCGYSLGVSQENSAGTLSISGLAFGVVLSVFAALNRICTEKSLSIFDRDSVRLTFYNNVNASVLFLPLVIVSNQLLTLFNSESFADYFFWQFLVISGIIRFVFIWLMAKLIDVTSPLTHLITANSASVLQTVVAVIYYQESKQLLWWFSIFLIVSGATAYAMVRAYEEKENDGASLSGDEEELPGEREKLLENENESDER